MGPETLPLLDHRDSFPAPRSSSSSQLQLLCFFSPLSTLGMLLCAALTGIQIMLPSLLRGIPDTYGLLVLIGASELLYHVTDGLWILVTIDVDDSFHDGLFGVALNDEERDSLRKRSLDTVLRISLTKLPVIAVALTRALYRLTGIPLAIFLSIAFLGVNLLFRYLVGQEAAIKENWARTLKRNRSFTERDGSAYRLSKADLKSSRVWRTLSDKGRAIVWLVGAVGLLAAGYYFGSELPVAEYGKIVKDISSLDAHMDKFSQCWVPASTLVATILDRSRGPGAPQHNTTTILPFAGHPSALSHRTPHCPGQETQPCQP